jgi:acetyl esterase/lipase
MSDHDQRDLGEYARAYRAYLPNPLQRWHPYVAPLESHRLAGLPAAFIVTAELDPLRREAEEYAVALIAAGVPTEVVRHRTTTHDAMQSDPAVLADVADFFTRRLARARPLRPAPQTGFSQY